MPAGSGSSRLAKDANKCIGQVNKIHGANTDYKVVATDGIQMFYNMPNDMPSMMKKKKRMMD